MIYRCRVPYTNHSYSSAWHDKVLYIEADCIDTAWAKAYAVTRDLPYDQVNLPEVEEYVPPKIDYVCSYEQVKREYGERLMSSVYKRLHGFPW